jgi:hypothetical protein
MLDEFGRRRKDFALADVFGARHRGETTPRATAGRVSVAADSQWDANYPPANLIDGKPTFWASGDSPMPHWAELRFAEPVDVAAVELVSRAGDYLVTDIDVETHDGNGWTIAASVRGAEKRTLAARLAKPVRTRRIRVKVLKELFQAGDRRIADVEAIRILDARGRDHARPGGTPAVRLVAQAGSKLTLPETLSLPAGRVARVEPAGATVLARFGEGDAAPAIVCSDFGRGKAYLIAPGEAALGADAA